MYTEKDYQANRLQLKHRLTMLGIPALLLLICIIWSFIVRIKWVTILATMVLSVSALFAYGMLLFPIIAYGRHLNDILHGRTHLMTGAFKTLGQDKVLREGVEFYPVILNVGRMDNEEDDRLLYIDANLPRPEWNTGDMLTLTIHDKNIGKWEKAEN